MSFLKDLTPNCDNTYDLHTLLQGKVNFVVMFEEATKTTIKVLMYTPRSRDISIGRTLTLRCFRHIIIMDDEYVGNTDTNKVMGKIGRKSNKIFSIYIILVLENIDISIIIDLSK